MIENKVILGSHVDMNKKRGYLVGSVKQAISQKANTMMIFTGPPQSTMRTNVSELGVEEFHKLCRENSIDLKNIIVHAPYLINLSNPIKKEVVEFSREFLIKEIKRVLDIGLEILVLHPGASVGGSKDDALKSLVANLDIVLDQFLDTNIKIALETMSGKGTEVFTDFDQIQYVMENLKNADKVGVCFDTCHLNDAGYDLKNNFNQVLEEFDKKVGLNKIWTVHLNDSKNDINSHKDRHENIGYGTIGFESLSFITHHEKLRSVPIVLETPYIDDFCPYADEISMLKNKTFKDFKAK